MEEININNFDEKLFYEKLDNGLEVFLLPNLNKKDYYCTFGTKYGGYYANFKVNGKEYHTSLGIAHFLEHKMFEKDDPSPFKFYGKTGTDVNASTNMLATEFYIFGNNAFLDNLKYLLNWVIHFKTTPEKVLKEKGIILEEAHMYDDYPLRVLFEKTVYNAFVKDMHRYKVIGTDQSIKSITKEDLEFCYKSFYRPSNMFIIISGNFVVSDTMSLIKNELKDFKDNDLDVSLIEEDEPDQVFKEYEELEMNVSIPNVSLTYKMNKNIFKGLGIDSYLLDYYIHMILSLGFGETSDFREKLLNDNMFDSFNYQVLNCKNHYLISFIITTLKPKEVIDEINKYILSIKFNLDDFKRIKKLWIASEVRISDSINASASNLLMDLLDYGEFKNNKISDIRSLDYNILKEVYKLFNYDNKSIVIIYNKK